MTSSSNHDWLLGVTDSSSLLQIRTQCGDKELAGEVRALATVLRPKARERSHSFSPSGCAKSCTGELGSHQFRSCCLSTARSSRQLYGEGTKRCIRPDFIPPGFVVASAYASRLTVCRLNVAQ